MLVPLAGEPDRAVTALPPQIVKVQSDNLPDPQPEVGQKRDDRPVPRLVTPPTTPAELLAWCKANPNRLIYARPANSGPGRTFIMGLPYILGDKNPKDPVNGWEKTWAYLKELNSCIEYYPTGTGIVMKELGEGTRDMTLTMTGWDINRVRSAWCRRNTRSCRSKTSPG